MATHSNMNRSFLFVDGSVNVESGVGYGAYLHTRTLDESLLDTASNGIQLKRFTSTSSTKLELETLLWALDQTSELKTTTDDILTIYTDSQNIIGLPGRRKILQQNNYYSKKNVLLKNHLLYKKLFYRYDQLNFELKKVKGHKASSEKDLVDRYFSLIDKAARRAMRKDQHA